MVAFIRKLRKGKLLGQKNQWLPGTGGIFWGDRSILYLKRVHYYSTSPTRYVKGTYLRGKGEATTRGKKSMKGKFFTGKSNIY